ncbi:MAG: DUF2934 domain-containing protein [Nitrospiraceae bacterium]|nr:DUF2934 domain-containing protein [Nitrospiraceae bacterium]
MKSQKAQAARGGKSNSIVRDQPGAAAPNSKPERPVFDDLHRRITIRAYELYVQRGCREGCAVEDWLDAEREITSHASFSAYYQIGAADGLRESP